MVLIPEHRFSGKNSLIICHIFYESFKRTPKITNLGNLSKVTANFKANIGKGSYNEFVDRHGLRIRNEKGNRFNQFCMQNQFKVFLNNILNISTIESHIVRNQIDCVPICVNF